MKLSRCLLAFSAFAFIGIAVPFGPVPVAQAQTPCVERVIPQPVLDGVSFGTGVSGSYAVYAGGTPTLAAAGAAPAALSAGTVAAVAGAVLLSVLGTCAVLDGPVGAATVGKFIDWMTRDGDAMNSQPLAGVASVSSPAGWQPCTSEVPTASGSAWTGVANMCIREQFTTTMGSNGNFISTLPGAFTIGGNSFVQPPATGPYWGANQAITGSWIRWPWTDSPTTGSCTHGETAAYCTGFSGRTSAVLAVMNAQCLGASVAVPTGYGYGLGGNCGRHPRETIVKRNNANTDVQAVFNLNSLAAKNGWSRVIVTDVQCVRVSDQATSWVRATSGAFWDREVTTRIPTPECAANYVPKLIRTQRIPTGLSCTIGSVCGSTDWIIGQLTMPAALTATATAPAWITCLAGTSCGAPVDTAGVCAWNGGTVASNFCTLPKIGDAVTMPVTVPRATGPVANDVNNFTEGTPQNTTTLSPPVTDTGGGGTGTGVTVNIPIDEGGGECSGRAGCIAVIEPNIGDGKENECWPDGWGWFNPAEWMLRPVKCALVWAFVPKDGEIQAAWADLNTAAHGHVPLSWIADGLELSRDLVDGLGPAVSANEDTCITWLADFGAAPSCLGTSLSSTSWPAVRVWLGRLVVFFFGLWVLSEAMAIVNGHRTPKTESFYVYD